MAKTSLFNSSSQSTVVTSTQNVKNHTFVQTYCSHIRQRLEQIFDTCFSDCGAVEAIVKEPITPETIGYVLYDRALWPAEMIGSGKLMPGSTVEVVGHREHVLRVIPCVPSPILP